MYCKINHCIITLYNVTKITQSMINKKNITKFGVVVLLSILFIACNSSANNTELLNQKKQVIEELQDETTVKEAIADDATSNQTKNKPISITSDQFAQLVADFRKDKEWKFKGKKACVVDFYADWCRPCKMMEPAFEKVAEKYAGKVDFYKINVDYNKDISSAYQITGIPTLFFCSANGKMTRIAGYLTEEQIITNVDAILAK